jgi:aminoglycoside phosphotransferase (APT) family kinase protein
VNASAGEDGREMTTLALGNGLAGIDARAVGEWIAAEIGGVELPLRFRLISGGRSNLTYAAEDAAGRRLVVRRPPLGELLESAHDMRREHHIIAALGGGPVPVPVALGYCADPAVTGAPFYVMEHVDGEIVRDEAAAERLLSVEARVRASESLIDVLADLHLLDLDRSGLASLARHDGYVERQLKRWQRQWQAIHTRELPQIEAARRLLQERRPQQQRASIVHGDYRLDNVSLDAAGNVCAVLDWELCTIGDPLADLGMLLLSWIGPGESSEHMLSPTPTSVSGFLQREQLLARYARATGLDVSQVNFYVALSYWKLACIAEGIYVRASSGAMGETSAQEVSRTAMQVPWLAELALRELDA